MCSVADSCSYIVEMHSIVNDCHVIHSVLSFIQCTSINLVANLGVFIGRFLKLGSNSPKDTDFSITNECVS